MATIVIVDGQRFPGDQALQIDAAYTPTLPEKTYIDSLKTIFDAVAAEPPAPPELAEEMDALRKTFCAGIRKMNDEFVALPPGPDRDRRSNDLFLHTLRQEGAYRDRRRQKLSIPFVVRAQRDKAGLVTDVVIETRDAPIPDDKQKLKIDIDRAATVIKAVLGDAPQGATGKPKAQRSAINARKRDDYLSALSGIAAVGLMNQDKSQTPFAALALNGLKDEFVAREAGIIKNAYVWRLGVGAGLTMLVCVALYFLLAWLSPSGLANFAWLWAGAAIGAWLSFSLRRVALGFADLAVLEDDRLTPELRILFVVALTTIVGVILWTGMVSVTIGTFSTQLKAGERLIPLDLAIGAFLIGALCGIAERSMASAVSRRAEDFAASFGKVAEAPR